MLLLLPVEIPGTNLFQTSKHARSWEWEPAFLARITLAFGIRVHNSTPSIRTSPGNAKGEGLNNAQEQLIL